MPTKTPPMDRYWINQPSTLQPCHAMHGMLVIAPRDRPTDDAVTVYPTTGPTISMMVPWTVLSEGWPDHLTHPRIAPLATDSN